MDNIEEIIEKYLDAAESFCPGFKDYFYEKYVCRGTCFPKEELN